MLPISKAIVEIASFDQQKMMNPEISGIEYQQGTLQGYEVREYLLEKYHRTCQYCQKTNIPLEVEHIISKACGGTDRVSNLTIACHKCNQDKDTLSAEEFSHPKIQAQALQSLKASAFMNNIRQRLAEQLVAESTYGYITKHNRIKLGLDKTHYNDAFIISKGATQERCKLIIINQTTRNNRCLQLNRKGFKPSVRRTRYKLQPKDKIQFKGITALVNGVHSYGTQILCTDTLGNKFHSNIKNVRLLTYGKGIIFV